MFLSLADRDKDNGLVAARRFAELGFAIAATAGTADMLERAGIAVDTVVAKVGEQVGVDAVDLISSGKVDLVVNTPRGRGPAPTACTSGGPRSSTGSSCVTTVAAALAAAARDRRGVPERARSPLAAGVPPRQPAQARAVKRGSRPASSRVFRRRSGPVDLVRRSRAGASPESRRRRVGNVRSRRGSRGTVRPARARRGHGEVGRRVSRGRVIRRCA